MTDKKTIQGQNISDLVRLVAILAEILETKELTAAENMRLNYGTKILKDVTEKVKNKKWQG